MTKIYTERIHLKVKPSMKERIKLACKKLNCTESELVREAIRRFIKAIKRS